jgi:hypothetical protein
VVCFVQHLRDESRQAQGERMKKLMAGLLFAALATGGLVGISSTTASADPYPGTVKTTVLIKAKKKTFVGHKAKIKVTVTASGNAQPAGEVKIVVKRVGGGAKFKRKVSYAGGTVKFKTKKLFKTGRYKIKVKYLPPTGSVFAKSKAKGKFKVKRKR